MPLFALFDFFQENAVDVGKWEWILDHDILDHQMLLQSTEVIVQWPIHARIIKSLGKKPITVIQSETKECAARVIKTGDDLQILREMANRVLSGSPTLPEESQKRQRKINLKYKEPSDDEETKPQISKKRKKISSKNAGKMQELKLSKKIEADLNSKLRFAKATDVEVSDGDLESDTDDEGVNGTLQKRYFLLEQENKTLKARNKKLNERLNEQKGISDVLDAVEKLGDKIDDSFKERRLPSISSVYTGSPKLSSSGYQSPKAGTSTHGSSSCIRSPPIWPSPISHSPSPARSPLQSMENQLTPGKMITLWEGMQVTEAQKKLLNGKKANVRDYVNTMLRMVFKGVELADSSLTGKTSNAFKNLKVAKPKLRDVDHIIDHVKRETGGSDTKIKASITQLLNNESKRTV